MPNAQSNRHRQMCHLIPFATILVSAFLHSDPIVCILKHFGDEEINK
jgi:hypothetical protein